MVVVEQIGIVLSDVVLFGYFIIGKRRTWTKRKEWWVSDTKMLDLNQRKPFSNQGDQEKS